MKTELWDHYNSLKDQLHNMDQLASAIKNKVQITLEGKHYPYNKHKLCLTVVGDHGSGVDAKIIKLWREDETSVKTTTYPVGMMTESGAVVMRIFQEEDENKFDVSILRNVNEHGRISFAKKFVLSNIMHATQEKSNS